MALDQSGLQLANLIVATIPIPPSTSQSDADALTASQLAYWTPICAAIMSYITTNAVVSTTDSAGDTGDGTIS